MSEWVSEWVSACVREWVSEWVRVSCLAPREQFFSYIMHRTCYFVTRWWCWCLFCWVRILNMLAHWNNRFQINMSLYLDKLSWLLVNISLRFHSLLLCTNFIIFGFTRPRLEPTIYLTRYPILYITILLWKLKSWLTID